MEKHNLLRSLPHSIAGLTKLQRLYLRGNQLTSLPDAIGGLTNLQALYLSRNQLTSPPDSLSPLKLNLLILEDIVETRCTSRKLRTRNKTSRKDAKNFGRVLIPIGLLYTSVSCAISC
jgi:Leucine-rich repeat (LRR) protein